MYVGGGISVSVTFVSPSPIVSPEVTYCECLTPYNSVSYQTGNNRAVAGYTVNSIVDFTFETDLGYFIIHLFPALSYLRIISLLKFEIGLFF